MEVEESNSDSDGSYSQQVSGDDSDWNPESEEEEGEFLNEEQIDSDYNDDDEIINNGEKGNIR